MTPKRKRAQRARAGVLVLSVMVFFVGERAPSRSCVAGETP